jgi:protein-S-isoprenylcysteine O-methyltransferase Ste14
MPWYVEAVYIVWIGSEILLARLRRAAPGARGGDRHSLAILWVVIVASVTAAVVLSLRTRADIPGGQVLEPLGLLMILSGVFFRLLVVRSLGRSFTVDVSVMDGQELRTTGFHHRVRHPSYAFSLLSFLGFGLSLGNTWSLMAAFVPPLLAFRYRIQVEEALLLRHFGEVYSAYMKRTRMLLPYLY